MSRSKKVPDQSSSLPGVLSEDDYNIPFIKVIEWVKRSWDSISQEKNFLSWKKTVIVNFKNQWPASDRKVSEDARMLLSTLMSSLLTFNPQKSFEKLKEIMNYLNAVIPWDIDDLIGLANERSTICLNYISIDEIIGSCMLGSHYEEHEPMYMEENLTAPIETSPNAWFGAESHSLVTSSSVPRLIINTGASSKRTSGIETELNLKSATPLNLSLAFLPCSTILPTKNALPLLNEQDMKFPSKTLEDYSSVNPNAISINALLPPPRQSVNICLLVGYSPLVPGREVPPPVLALPLMYLSGYRKHRINGPD